MKKQTENEKEEGRGGLQEKKILLVSPLIHKNISRN